MNNFSMMPGFDPKTGAPTLAPGFEVAGRWGGHTTSKIGMQLIAPNIVKYTWSSPVEGKDNGFALKGTCDWEMTVTKYPPDSSKEAVPVIAKVVVGALIIGVIILTIPEDIIALTFLAAMRILATVGSLVPRAVLMAPAL